MLSALSGCRALSGAVRGCQTRAQLESGEIFGRSDVLPISCSDGCPYVPSYLLCFGRPFVVFSPVRQRDWSVAGRRPQSSVTHPPLPLVFCLGGGFSCGVRACAGLLFAFFFYSAVREACILRILLLPSRSRPTRERRLCAPVSWSPVRARC